MVVPAVPTTALNAVPPADMGKASRVQNTLQRFGAVFGIAIVAAVFSAKRNLGSPVAMIAGMRPAFTSTAAITAVAGLILARRRRIFSLVTESPALGASLIIMAL